MGLLLLLSLLPLVVTRGFAISSPLRQSYGLIKDENRRIPPRIPHSKKNAVELLLRGGGDGSNNKRIARRYKSSTNDASSSDVSPSSNKNRNIAIIGAAFVTASLLLIIGYEYRAPLASFFNKEALQHRVLTLLHSFHGDWRGVVAYSCGMAVWELFGMSTIPVETAAGMVFGMKQGFLASAMGKLAGALAGFLLGKTVLHGFIGHRLEGNKIINLIHNHVNQNPIKVAMLMRYSLLPEVVKNCGASLFPPIKTWMFVLSIVLHGWIFTACWTYLGVDTARRLETPGLPVDRLAQFGVLWATVVGMILTPILMAWWIRDMQQSELNVIDENNDGKKKS